MFTSSSLTVCVPFGAVIGAFGLETGGLLLLEIMLMRGNQNSEDLKVMILQIFM